MKKAYSYCGKMMQDVKVPEIGATPFSLCNVSKVTLLDKRNALIIVTRSDGFEGKTMQTLKFHKSIHFIRQWNVTFADCDDNVGFILWDT